MSKEAEIWKPYPLCELYEISTLGRARSVRSGKVLKLAKTEAGRPFFGLCVDGKQKPCYLHRAVLLTFVGEPPVGHEACHENGNPSDNRLVNLRWDTRRANALDKRKHGTMTEGERHGRSKLTDDIVRQIRSDVRFSKQIAADYGVHYTTVCKIKSGRAWGHVQ
jgi:hypothetical protein